MNRLKEKMAMKMAETNNLGSVMARNAQEMVECAKVRSIYSNTQLSSQAKRSSAIKAQC